MQHRLPRVSLEAQVHAIPVITEDGFEYQAFALKRVQLHGCAHLPIAFSNVLLSAPEIPACSLNMTVFIRDGCVRHLSDGQIVVCCDALSVMRTVPTLRPDVDEKPQFPPAISSVPRNKLIFSSETCTWIAGCWKSDEKYAVVVGAVSRISVVFDVASDRPAFLVSVVCNDSFERMIAFLGRRMLVWRRVLVPGKRYGFMNVLPPSPFAVHESGPTCKSLHAYIVDDSCSSFRCDDLDDDVTSGTPVLVEYPRLLEMNPACAHLRVFKPRFSLLHDMHSITSNGSDAVGVYLPLGHIVNVEGVLTAIGTDWFELNGDERCTVWCLSGYQRDELFPYPLWLGSHVLCHNVVVISQRPWMGFAACASSYVRLLRHSDAGTDVSPVGLRMSTLPALLAEYGIAETLWARHIASSLHRSLRRTIARTDVLGRFGILSQLLEAFASKTLRDPCRLQQFVKHDCRVPIKQQFCFRQHASVQEIVDESYAIYYDARCAFEMTGKSNDNLQRTPDHQHFAATLASLAVGVMFTCPISGRTLFGDDTGCMPIVLRGSLPADFQLPMVACIPSIEVSSGCFRGSIEWSRVATSGPVAPSSVSSALFEDFKTADEKWMAVKRRRTVSSTGAVAFRKRQPDVYMDVNLGDVVWFPAVVPLRSLGASHCACHPQSSPRTCVRIVRMTGVKPGECGSFLCEVPATLLPDDTSVTLRFESDTSVAISTDAPLSSTPRGFPCWFSMLADGVELSLCSCLVTEGNVLHIPPHCRAERLPRKHPGHVPQPESCGLTLCVLSVRHVLGPCSCESVSVKGSIRDMFLLSGSSGHSKQKPVSGFRDWTGIGWTSGMESHPKLVVVLRDECSLDDVKIFLNVDNGVLPLGLKFDAPVIVHNITRKVSVNRKVYCSGDLSDDSWIEVNGVEMGRVVMPVASYPLFSLASFLSTSIDHGTSHRIVGTLTTVSWISLGWCCSHCDAWLAPYTEDDGVDDVDGSVVLVCPNACSTLSHDRVWKVETSGTFDDGSAEATLYARQEHAEMLLGMSSPDTLQYWKRTACRLGRVWSERDSLPACKAAETHARNCAVASLQQFDVIVRRFRSRKYGGDASRLRLETLQVSVTEPKSYCRDLLDKLRSLE